VISWFGDFIYPSMRQNAFTFTPFGTEKVLKIEGVFKIDG